MKRYSIEEMLKMNPQEFAKNWTEIGASAYEMIGGEVEEKIETTEEAELRKFNEALNKLDLT